MKKDFIFGITTNDDEIDENYKEKMKTEYDLSEEEIKELKYGHLFRLSDNVRFSAFDADIVLFSEEKETYFHTGDFEPINKVENKDIIALVDENCELEII